MRCCKDDYCRLLSQIADLFQCVEILRKPPGKPPNCTSTCRSLVSKVLNTDYGSDLLTCDCSTVEKEKVPKMNYLCRPFQLHAEEKCYPITGK